MSDDNKKVFTTHAVVERVSCERSVVAADAMRSDYVLIPVYPCLKDSRVLQTAVHPYDLVNYGERAWCRLEM